MKKIYILILLAALPFASCKKFLDVPPKGNLREDLFTNASDAQQTLNSCYDALANLYDGRIQNINELLTDNLNVPNSNNDLRSVYARQVTYFNSTTNKVYQDLYTVIFRCNTLIDNIDLITDFASGQKEQMIAEARFLRGFCHWTACKLWAQPYGFTPDNSHWGVPLRTSANADPILRNTVKEVYDFVLADLQFAEANLPETNSFYATKYSAAGVLALVNFQMNNFSTAANYCSEVINSGQFSLLSGLDRFPNVSMGSNTTSEFVFGTVTNEYSTDNGGLFDRRCGNFVTNYQVNNSIAELSVSQNFFDFISLNPSDQRDTTWIKVEGSRYFLKKMFRNSNFSIPIVHLTELKLIRAEALAESNGDLTTAIQDINDIRNRAFVPGTNELSTSATASQIIDAARVEYRIETIGEGKYIDQLKRRGAKGENIVIRNAPWNCNGMAIQFPNSESTVIGFQLNPEGGCN
jgi:starch-binding outer membrane protein, SusD/RagB family